MTRRNEDLVIVTIACLIIGGVIIFIVLKINAALEATV